MKIMIIDYLPEEIATALLCDNISYRPDLRLKTPSILIDALRVSGTNAIVSQMDLSAMIFAGHGLMPLTDLVLVDIGCATAEPTHDAATLGEGLILTTVHASTMAAGYLYALETLERYAAERMAFIEPDTGVLPSIGRRDAVVIGAGLVNLITAYRLVQEGYELRIFDAAPDPSQEAPWMAYGCSRGGDDARMFTLSEMDNYNDRSPSANMNSLFSRDVVSAGWSAARPGTLSQDELSWISDFESLPIWLANTYNEDIFGLSRSSRTGWDEWIVGDPELFRKCEMRRDILRIYSSAEHFALAVERQNRIGATLSILTPAEVRVYQPTLADAVDAGLIAGGIVVVGFTVNAHKFISILVSRLIAAGAQFEWNARADGVALDPAGTVEGVWFGERLVAASNYVISPGAYARGLLDGTRSEGRIHGVLGAWLRLPNLSPCLEHSLKLARKGHITEDANITVAIDTRGEPIMIIGSGYGHTGVDPMNVDQHLLQNIYNGLIDTARCYFPKAYDAARTRGDLEGSLKYCVRPWTANGLGLFEMRGTARGGRCIVTGGHNTGGFAQSPTIADAVVEGLNGRRHAMHSLYHPDRSSTFLERARVPKPRLLTERRISSIAFDENITESNRWTTGPMIDKHTQFQYAEA